MNSKMGMPHGFRFTPKDDEAVDLYLLPKVSKPSLHPDFIETIDIYDEHTPPPWELFNSRDLSRKNDLLYFFTELKSKSGRNVRKTEQGTWSQQATEPVENTSNLEAYKTAFSYCHGKKEGSTGWVMNQFKLEGDQSWTLCEIHFAVRKNNKIMPSPAQQGIFLGATSSSDQAIHHSATMPTATAAAAADHTNKLPKKSLKRKFNDAHELKHSSKQQRQSVGDSSVYSHNFDYSQPQSSHLCSSIGSIMFPDPAPVFEDPPRAATDEQNNNNNNWEDWRIMAENDNIMLDYSKLCGLGDEFGELFESDYLLNAVAPLFECDYQIQSYNEEASSDLLFIQQASDDQWLPA